MKHQVNLVRALSLATGAALCLIGVRFLLQPHAAGTFFGIDPRWPGYAPHSAIALRDLWVGALLLAFTALKDWRAVALWLGFGALVCFGDAIIAASSSGRWGSITFHAASGVFCAGLAAAAWHLARARSATPQA
jgi:hypothetical protein